MSKWPTIELDEIIVRRNGSIDPSKFQDEEFELYSIPSFDAGEPEFLAGSQIGSSKQIIQDGDVLLSKIVPHIRRAWVVNRISERRLIASGEWIVFRSALFDANYLRHALTSDRFHSQFMQTVSGVGGSLLRARPAEVAKIKVACPPLEEQKRIAAILDKADSLRRKRAQAIALADDFLRATFLDLFGDPVTNPKGWCTVKLEELILSGPTNGLYKPSSDYVDSDGDLGTPILRIDGFYNGKIAKGYKFKRVLLDDQTRAKYLLQDGSIVINRVNSKEYVGKAMLVSGLREDTVFESNMMNFSVDLGGVNPRFLVDQLADEFVRRQVAVMRKDAVNQSSINQQDVKSIEIRLPKLALQEKYAEIAETMDNLVFKFNGISIDLEHFSGSLHECLLASQAK